MCSRTFKRFYKTVKHPTHDHRIHSSSTHLKTLFFYKEQPLKLLNLIEPSRLQSYPALLAQLIKHTLTWMACVFAVLFAVSALAEESFPVALEGQYAPLKGVKLWYTDLGDKTAKDVVVMLHPNTGTSEVWSDQSRALAKAGYRAIAFDRRGWGKSVVESEADNGAQSIAEDLESLANYLKLDQFHLVGIAGGGFASLDYAAWQQKRLKSLIVGGSTGQLSDPSMKAIVQRLEIPGVRSIPAHYREVGPSYRARSPEGTKKWLEIEEHSMQKDAKSQSLRTLNTLDKISTIKVPTLLIAGGADLLAPPALMRMWGERIKGHQWVLIPEAGHALTWEESELFTKAMLDFLNQQTRR